MSTEMSAIEMHRKSLIDNAVDGVEQAEHDFTPGEEGYDILMALLADEQAQMDRDRDRKSYHCTLIITEDDIQ